MEENNRNFKTIQVAFDPRSGSFVNIFPNGITTCLSVSRKNRQVANNRVDPKIVYPPLQANICKTNIKPFKLTIISNQFVDKTANI